MYLIHVQLRPPAPGVCLPPRLAPLLRAMSHPDDRVEHIAVHADASPLPTLGVYLLADSLADAEERAKQLSRRWVTSMPLLQGWCPMRAEAPLVVPFYERLLSLSGRAGLNGPGTFPST
ncbi:hypothetical protein P3T36_001999 [Kitasatospora sp. MAP12-15]|uniref:hypothetical protein n=1 Tax=unclassified Kitasatospora TaxID=2633591 RepID=UPI002473D529|nr:hypothetical protein [Kitasatospora sp. MAP12-44]MDH6111684.1 hypothetical protein [Kitasatospora sp. MAP12-44]